MQDKTILGRFTRQLASQSGGAAAGFIGGVAVQELTPEIPRYLEGLVYDALKGIGGRFRAQPAQEESAAEGQAREKALRREAREIAEELLPGFISFAGTEMTQMAVKRWRGAEDSRDWTKILAFGVPVGSTMAMVLPYMVRHIAREPLEALENGIAGQLRAMGYGCEPLPAVGADMAPDDTDCPQDKAGQTARLLTNNLMIMVAAGLGNELGQELYARTLEPQRGR